MAINNLCPCVECGAELKSDHKYRERCCAKVDHNSTSGYRDEKTDSFDSYFICYCKRLLSALNISKEIGATDRHYLEDFYDAIKECEIDLKNVRISNDLIDEAAALIPYAKVFDQWKCFALYKTIMPISRTPITELIEEVLKNIYSSEHAAITLHEGINMLCKDIEGNNYDSSKLILLIDYALSCFCAGIELPCKNIERERMITGWVYWFAGEEPFEGINKLMKYVDRNEFFKKYYLILTMCYSVQIDKKIMREDVDWDAIVDQVMDNLVITYNNTSDSKAANTDGDMVSQDFQKLFSNLVFSDSVAR